MCMGLKLEAVVELQLLNMDPQVKLHYFFNKILDKLKT